MLLSQRTQFAVLFVAAVFVRLLFQYLTDFTADDALITFRYAENLIAGNGFVYNIGERVLGTTTPLFTFFLSIFLLTELSPFNASLFISIICSGLTSIVIFRFAQHLRFTKFSFIPALVYILWPRSIAGDTAGLETALFSLLIVSAFYFQQRELTVYSTALATLAALTRPEGFFLLGIIFLYNVLTDKENFVAYLLVPSAMIIPWFAFSYFYFGTVIPNSVVAKLALYTNLATEPVWQKLVYLLGWHNPLGWFMSAVAVIGSWWLIKKQNFGKLEISWLLIMLAFFSFGRTEIFFWYPVPIYPVYIIIAVAALPMLVDRFNIPQIRLAPVAATLAVIFCITLVYMTGKQIEYYKWNARYLSEIHKAIGLYLKENALPTDTVAARYIGNTGYYSNLRIIDRDGIVTPSAHDYNRRGDYLGFLLDHRPEWVVAAPTRPTGGFAIDKEFIDNYELIKPFGWDDEVRHILYKRKIQYDSNGE